MSTATETEKPAMPSVWHRLRCTPLLDLLRGRLSGSLDYQQVIQESELSEAVQQIIVLTLKRSRLWASEKVDLAIELVAHFQDGLSAQVDEQQLMDQFGDPAVAGKLMGRGKRRNRPLWWKLLYWMRNSIATVAAVYVLLIAYYWTLTPTISVDYVSLYNRGAMETLEQDRAWPVYQQVAQEFGHDDYKAFGKLFHDDVSEAERLEQAKKLFEAHPQAMELLRKAAGYPSLGVVASPFAVKENMLFPEVYWTEEAEELVEKRKQAGPGMSIEILLPHAQEIRRFTRMACLDALLALQENEPDRFYENVVAMYRMAHQVKKGKTLVEQLIAFAVISKAEEVLHRGLREQPEMLSDQQLVSLAHQMGRLDSIFDIDPTVERMMFYDVVQRIYSDDGNGDGVLTAQGVRTISQIDRQFRSFEDSQVGNAVDLIIPVFSMYASSRKELVEVYDDLMDRTEVLLRKPFWEVEPDDYPFTTWNEGLTNWEKPRMLPLLTFHISDWGMHTAQQRRIATRDATLFVIAAELYRRKQGAWPQTMDELVSGSMPDVIRDRYTGEPIRFKVVDDQIVVYSVGPDLEDDGGQLVAQVRKANMTTDEWVKQSNKKTWLQRIRTASPNANVHQWLSAEEVIEGDWVLWYSKDWSFD